MRGTSQNDNIITMLTKAFQITKWNPRMVMQKKELVSQWSRLTKARILYLGVLWEKTHANGKKEGGLIHKRRKCWLGKVRTLCVYETFEIIEKKHWAQILSYSWYIKDTFSLVKVSLIKVWTSPMLSKKKEEREKFDIYSYCISSSLSTCQVIVGDAPIMSWFHPSPRKEINKLCNRKKRRWLSHSQTKGRKGGGI